MKFIKSGQKLSPDEKLHKCLGGYHRKHRDMLKTKDSKRVERQLDSLVGDANYDLRKHKFLDRPVTLGKLGLRHCEVACLDDDNNVILEPYDELEDGPLLPVYKGLAVCEDTLETPGAEPLTTKVPVHVLMLECVQIKTQFFKEDSRRDAILPLRFYAELHLL